MFDVIRVLAACAVVVSHAFPLTGHRAPVVFESAGRGFTLGRVAVGVFFVTSGFLIAASWERSTPARFALRRVLRLVPGLMVATVFVVLVIGPLVTTGSAWGVWFDSETWRMVGSSLTFQFDAHRSMPGVFESNPLPDVVNGSLWTLAHEVACYVMLAGVGALGVLRSRAATMWLTLAVLAVMLVSADWTGAVYGLRLADLAMFGAWFALGALLHVLGVRWSREGLLAATVACVAAGALGSAIVVPAFAVMVILVGMAPVRRGMPTWLGDPSYGIYVLAFPIQQAIATTSLDPWINMVATLAVVAPLGVASWWLVEARAMRLGRSARPGEQDAQHPRVVGEGVGAVAADSRDAGVQELRGDDGLARSHP